MEDRGTLLLELVSQLAGLDRDEFTQVLDEAIKSGYVTKTEFERFVHGLHERFDGQDRVVELMVKNVELQLQADTREGFDKYVEEKLPAAIAQHNREQRSDIVNFFRKRFMLIVSIIMTITAALSLWAAIQSNTELRDLKNIARVANEFNDALDP